MKLPNLPKGIQIRHGWYVYRPWDKKAKQHAPQIRLVPEGSHLAEIMDAYNRITAKSVWNLRSLIKKYMDSPQFNNLSITTQKGYEQCLKNIDNVKLTIGKSLLDISFTQWTPGLTRKYLDVREAKTQANREVQFMRSVFSWGYERDFCPSNPCKGVRLNSKPPRDRYVTDGEFKTVFDIATQRMQLCMLLAYKCRLRRSEVLNLKRKHLTKEGILCVRTKGSKTTIVEWDSDLRKAINDYASKTKVTGPESYVVHNGSGIKFHTEAFSTEWQRLMKKALVSGLRNRFTFHDLKAKGISDDNGDKQRGSGHKSASMMNVYDRKPAKVSPIRSKYHGTSTARDAD